jgi:hypothetical protein
VPGDWNPREDEVPSFTGDIPTDAVRTVRLLDRSFVRRLQARSARFGLCCGTAFAAFAVVSLVHVKLHPGWLESPGSAVEVGAAILAVLSAGASFVRPIPAVVRFVLGVVPGSCGTLIGMASGLGDQRWAGWVGFGGLLGLAVFALVAGIRLRSWAEDREARLDGDPVAAD